MLRSELVDIIARENAHLTKVDAEKVLNVLLEEIIAKLENGGRIELRGFGVFGVKTRDARHGRNPKTGEAVDVEAKQTVYFRIGRELLRQMNPGTKVVGTDPA
ncbi:HU family DNA-binding protein [Paracoccus litorisediminis]|uniref:HU family DNA-binding protein n=1 Tax=Paracoccus litorisediminis TaxID=2006130 RepID=UPI0037341777